VIRITTFPGTLSPAGAASGAAAPDHASASWDGVEFTTSTKSGACAALARRLVAAGCPDQPWEAYSPSGQRLLFGRSLHRLAATTLMEPDRGRLRRVRWKAFTDPRFQEAAE
jgi:hypothetical protein